MSRSKPPPPNPSATDQSRNEYIPSFISKKPFYIDESTSDADYLEHQRLQSAPKDTLDKAKWYERGRKAGPAATKYRKGACENCGAMTHKTKECLSRPRKQGAKWTGRDIQADEVVDDVQLGWDAKRDRWNGYDSREYNAVVKEYEELEALKKAAAGISSDQKLIDGEVSVAQDSSDARYGEETDMGRSQPTSTRQLRLREDTAKYLLNLDLDSAKYDPKTRSMDVSAQSLSNNPDASVADEGFVRPTDDAAEFARAQNYAWETQENSTLPDQKKLHLQANPTEGEILRRKQTVEAAEKKAAQRKALLDKYGDQASHKPTALQKQNQVLENERYVEYDESGRIKGEERKVARSKYAEDVFINNHTSVWGSWWRDFQWGYSCCHSTVKNSYCTGDAGRRGFEDAENMRTGEALMLQLENGGDPNEDQVDNKSAVNLESTSTNDEKKKEGNVAKKRTLQELQSGVTEEEMETYKRNRTAADDPMATMLGKDVLIN